MGLSCCCLCCCCCWTTLQAGNSARCDPKMDFRMDQPEHLSAPKGGTVHINFTSILWGISQGSQSQRVRSLFLQILNLREEDENMYFCRVQLKTQRFGLQSVQSILGTNSHIYLAPKTTTKGPTSTVTTTTGLSVLEGNRTSVSLPLSVEAVVKVALTIAVLKTVILGLTLYLRWKTSKGKWFWATPPPNLPNCFSEAPTSE
ncbi:paired immunoglobulin-like type 2 receptor beta isoform X24 [Canis lupus familiaris]|uniref:paired immunoglobulin-like type 2 receptor beta isoform X24 n=1 Tax=Canis lupus familiaris TaxID=9615 RepID=UPI0018F6FE78|nr:paired immunoglobulin-like type 2 receptor beta isoform X24 [Canis lupus familiaris]